MTRLRMIREQIKAVETALAAATLEERPAQRDGPSATGGISAQSLVYGLGGCAGKR
jgi:hypothetical protein